MPAVLKAVDRLLDDEEFFKPFRPHFHAILGRPSVPIETYLRLMFLKYRYRLGFEPLCREVADSISWQRFCRIPLGVAVPHPTTLMKITTRCGSSAVEGLNEAHVVWIDATVTSGPNAEPQSHRDGGRARTCSQRLGP
jgi:IS5 family transposase